jgi:exodeoxyribonuclease III
MTKIISYNLNGIRASFKKGMLEWLGYTSPDIICLQELKANQEQVDNKIIEDLGYNIYWQSAQKKGYSGVAILSKTPPLHVEYGCGEEKYDNEGRVIRADYENYSIMSVYMPSGTSGTERQAFKMDWLDFFYDYVKSLIIKHKNLIISGDFNICHKPIDIHNPVSNKKSSGFLPEERAWVSHFLEAGFIDTFRYFNPDPHHYTWWSYRVNARDRNLGWRIDYNMASKSMKKNLVRAVILTEARHSDHCPVLLEIK